MAAESEIQSFFEQIGAALKPVSEGLGAAYNAVMEGGEVQAFFRQGIGELGNALVAFPNGSLHHEEPGAIFTPIYSDIAESREAYRTSPADLTESLGQAGLDQQSQQESQSHGISV